MQQALPREPSTTDGGGTAITIAREGFLHVAMLPLRDLLPFAGRLVAGGFVAERRFEDEPDEREGWGRTTAAFRTMAATVGTAVEQELVFTDDEGAIESFYPTATVARIHLDATRAGAFEGLGFERVLELTRQESAMIVGLNAHLAKLTDKFMSDLNQDV